MVRGHHRQEETDNSHLHLCKDAYRSKTHYKHSSSSPQGSIREFRTFPRILRIAIPFDEAGLT